MNTKDQFRALEALREKLPGPAFPGTGALPGRNTPRRARQLDDARIAGLIKL